VPVWGRERPRRQPVLSRDAIVQAAIRIADAEGLAAVSIRRVAGDLGVRPMSLYTYVDRKEDLLALMRDHVNGEVLLGADLPDGWRDGLVAIARRTREVTLRHPWLVDTAAHGALIGPNALRHMEESLAALRDSGLGPLAAAEVLYAVDKYVLGHVAFEVADRNAFTERLAARPYVESLLATGEFPALSQLASGGMALVTDEPQYKPQYEPQFERGLAWLLDGIAADITAAS
jgi:AcrR family transcriptional regulator